MELVHRYHRQDMKTRRKYQHKYWRSCGPYCSSTFDDMCSCICIPFYKVFFFYHNDIKLQFLTNYKLHETKSVMQDYTKHKTL